VIRRVVVVVAQVVLLGVVVGCGSSSTAATASPTPTLSASDKTALGELESRPLKLPSLLPDGTCRPDEADPTTGRWGSDPVFLVGGQHVASPYGDYYDVSAWTKVGLAGPVLLRGQDLKVHAHPVVFVSRYAVAPIFTAGPVYGTDASFGPQYTELVLDTRYTPDAPLTVNGSNYVVWAWRQGIGKGWTGCIGFQIDAPGFSRSINVNVPTG
jgi:hypothetical protein